MKKIFVHISFIQNFFNNTFINVVNFFHIKNNKLKRHLIVFLQTNVFLLLSILLFSLVMRPIALDIVEMQNKDDTLVVSDTPEEIAEEENPFPFEMKKPPEGVDRKLTRAEMRWIFKEEIRLNAMKRIINDGNERAHRAYSAMVRDFNVRGANFKYELRDKTCAENDVEVFREEIVENAIDEAKSYGWGQL